MGAVISGLTLSCIVGRGEASTEVRKRHESLCGGASDQSKYAMLFACLDIETSTQDETPLG